MAHHVLEYSVCPAGSGACAAGRGEATASSVPSVAHGRARETLDDERCARCSTRRAIGGSRALSSLPDKQTGPSCGGRPPALRTAASSKPRSAADDLEQPLDDEIELFGGRATQPSANALHRERSNLADLDPGRLRQPGARELEREQEAGARRLDGERNRDDRTRAFVEDVVTQKQGIPVSFGQVDSSLTAKIRSGKSGKGSSLPKGSQGGRPVEQLARRGGHVAALLPRWQPFTFALTNPAISTLRQPARGTTFSH
jgi:hypothetical protein